MKKRLFCLLLTLCLVLGLVPATTLAAGESATAVATAAELTAALADDTIPAIRLTEDVTVGATLNVSRTVTLDLDGHVLRYQNTADIGSVLAVSAGGHLTVRDGNTGGLSHRFTPDADGLWVLNEETGTETVTGGVITGGTGRPRAQSSSGFCEGGGVYVASGGMLTMTGGNIVGCTAKIGGGVYVRAESSDANTRFIMTGGSIAGCVATGNGGGGVGVIGEGVVFRMSGTAAVRDCRSIGMFGDGAGVSVSPHSTFEMADRALISGCIAAGDFRADGGGVLLDIGSTLTMSGQARIEDCKAIFNRANSSAKGGGIYAIAATTLTMKESAAIRR